MASSKSNGNPNSPWRQVDRAILDKAGANGVVGIFKENGLVWADHWRVTGDWASHDKKGCGHSTSINVKEGFLHDHNGGDNVWIWHWCATHGRFTNWEAAQKHYAERYGISLPKSTRGRSASSSCRTRIPAVQNGPEIPQYRDDLTDVLTLFKQHAKDHGHHDRVARDLGVCPWALEDVNMGVMPPDYRSSSEFSWKLGCSVFPEITVTDDDRRIPLSANQRHPEGSPKGKEALFNRPRGITIPLNWMEGVRRTGYLIIPEGASDCAAAISMGLGVLGYWAAGRGADYLTRVIRRAITQGRIPGRFKIILTRDINNDGYANTATAKIAQHLADRLTMPVWHVLMPFDPNWVAPPEKDTLLAAPERQLTDRELNALVGEVHYENYLWEKEKERQANLPPPRPMVYKDVRAWLNVRVPDAHTRKRGELNHVGLEFIEQIAEDILDNATDVFVPRRLNHDYLGSEHDETTEDDARKSLASFREALLKLLQESVPSGCGSCSHSSVSKKSNSRLGGTDSCTDTTVTPIPDQFSYTTVWDFRPITALEALSWTKCPDRRGYTMTRVNDPHCGRRLPVSCCCWWCVGCGGRRRLEWAKNIRARLREAHVAKREFHVWRGPKATFTQKIGRRIKGEYFRVQVDATDVLCVSDRPFPESSPIAGSDAHRDLIAAVAAIVVSRLAKAVKPAVDSPEDAVPVKKAKRSRKGQQQSRPVTASRCWSICAISTESEWKKRGKQRDKDDNFEKYDAVLEACGVIVLDAGTDRAQYQFPLWMSEADIMAVIGWAETGVPPAGWAVTYTTDGMRHPVEVSRVLWEATPDWWEGGTPVPVAGTRTLSDKLNDLVKGKPSPVEEWRPTHAWDDLPHVPTVVADGPRTPAAPAVEPVPTPSLIDDSV
jgi:hypothetical protein